ncbi:glycoside hydrolase family 3 C-terminal domain-containing protein [Rhodanobacter sp. PCA2]|uniref:glycoside hydrolase family 3 C-terminal domain-containing protein n=1 Tax=Rhodanobacter sp. PCA2 TaxID=2006117 RepID=UPI0015E78906|nr:glycoside hydrolase family 3 C-terminal domain-containing protein [Rhodanobacter sp. PCA2]MBA2077636.1 beta-glucosidase [Rhodanobacter sp. PCA2]
MRKTVASIAAVALLLSAGATAAPAQDAEARAAALVAKMTLAEKVSQLQNDASAIPRLGVPAYDWWNEGLHGHARDGYATVFPQAIGLAASWDAPLLEHVGRTVAVEARARFNAIGAGRDHGQYQGLSIWSPNINIFRDPRWGRGQETYGEDPFLAGRLAVAFVRGIQGDDARHPLAIATPKHFVAHSGPETGRDSFDARVSPHDLEDTYLPAFRAAVVEGGAGSLMCSYNALDGVPMCANPALLDTRLRKDWGFKGYVVSDCDAVGDIAAFHHYKPDDAQASAVALRAGTDLDCGHTYASLAKAVRAGDVAEPVLDTALLRLFAVRYRLGELGGPGDDPHADLGPGSVDSPAHRQLALQAAQESLVLLKNAHDTLPLRAGLRLAVIGPNADTLETLEANYHGTARAPVTPLAGLRARFGAERVSYAQGAPVAAGVPVPVPETALRTPDGAAGLTGEYYAGADFHGKPLLVRTDRVIDFDWNRAAPAPGLDAGRYAVRWSGELLPPGPGDYVLAVHVDRCFDCSSHDAATLFLDGKRVELRSRAAGKGGDASQLEARVHFADARPQAIRLELLHASPDEGVRLQWLAPPAVQLAEAERAVRQADAVVAFVGLSPDVEGEALQIEVPGFEGGDRTDIGLPPAQRALLERVAASGKPLVVVLMSGSAVALDWAREHADAILVAWYPGQAGGTAIAQALAGDSNPGGRLPVTFYRSVRDLPPFTSYAMQGRTYRYFRGTPLYPFGYGLSYTRFAYAAPSVSASTLKAGATLEVGAELRNTGARAGDEVVQVYLEVPPSPLAPRHALVGFRRVHLEPGERTRVQFALTPRQLSSVDAAGARAVEPGRYRVFIGGGQPGDAAGVAATFTIEGREALAP